MGTKPDIKKAMKEAKELEKEHIPSRDELIEEDKEFKSLSRRIKEILFRPKE